MKKNPQLKASLLGNQPSLITPSRPPPSKKEVTMWMKAKSLLSKLNQEEITELKSRKAGTKEDKNVKEKDQVEDKNINKTTGKEGLEEQKPQKGVFEQTTPITSNKGKAGKGGKVKNPNFTGLKRKRSNDGEPGPSGPPQGLLTDSGIDESDVLITSPPVVEGGFKTPARRSRRSSSADGLLEERLEAPPPTASPLSIISQSPRAKRRRSVEDASPPQHSTPRVGDVSLTRRVSFLETLTPSCTPIKRTRPPVSPDTPSSSLKSSLKREDTLTLATPTTAGGRGLRRSATPPPLGSTPVRSQRKRRSITPPPTLSNSDSSFSQYTPSGSQDRTRTRPLRRLSTNTQSFLRRLIQSSQSKVSHM